MTVFGLLWVVVMFLGLPLLVLKKTRGAAASVFVYGGLLLVLLFFLAVTVKASMVAGGPIAIGSWLIPFVGPLFVSAVGSTIYGDWYYFLDLGSGALAIAMVFGPGLYISRKRAAREAGGAHGSP